MNGFIAALLNPDYSFIRNAVLAGLLSSVLFGVLGTLVSVRRIGGLAGAISHAVLGGIGMALFFRASGIAKNFSPMGGALIFAILSALIIALVSLKAKQREDTVINAIWVIGMSTGILFMAKTPGYIDPSAYLFGNILLISKRDLLLMGIMDVLVIFLGWRFFPQLRACAFDDEFARVRGVPSNWVFIVLLVITALAIVLLQTYVGIVMVIAMLTLPSGTSAFFSRNLGSMLIGSCVFSCLFSVCGLFLGWFLDTPVGATTVIIAGFFFLGTAALKALGFLGGGSGK